MGACEELRTSSERYLVVSDVTGNVVEVALEFRNGGRVVCESLQRLVDIVGKERVEQEQGVQLGVLLVVLGSATNGEPSAQTAQRNIRGWLVSAAETTTTQQGYPLIHLSANGNTLPRRNTFHLVCLHTPCPKGRQSRCSAFRCPSRWSRCRPAKTQDCGALYVRTYRSVKRAHALC